MTYRLQTKRVYEARREDDGLRVLVDRLWPRGVTKVEAALDLWLKEVAPTTELRRWFAHRPDRWGAFQGLYLRELNVSVAVGDLRRLASAEPVTLLYGARDQRHNHALVLAAFLMS
jgi:uncharacterized protein YeaO (DUF488 family)